MSTARSFTAKENCQTSIDQETLWPVLACERPTRSIMRSHESHKTKDGTETCCDKASRQSLPKWRSVTRDWPLSRPPYTSPAATSPTGCRASGLPCPQNRTPQWNLGSAFPHRA